MKIHPLTRPLTRAFALPALLALGGCAVFSDKPAEGLENVDHLLGRIERVHTEAQLSREASAAAVAALSTVVSGDQGEPTEAFAQFVGTVERSEKQAETFRESLEPMQSAADAVFAQWEADLEQFSGSVLRERSERRLADTRLRFEAIRKTAEPALVEYDLLNSVLRDCALYLGHDLNAQSVAGIRNEVASMARRAEKLDARLEKCMGAAEGYVRASALRGPVQAEAPDGAESRN